MQEFLLSSRAKSPKGLGGYDSYQLYARLFHFVFVRLLHSVAAAARTTSLCVEGAANARRGYLPKSLARYLTPFCIWFYKQAADEGGQCVCMGSHLLFMCSTALGIRDRRNFLIGWSEGDPDTKGRGGGALLWTLTRSGQHRCERTRQTPLSPISSPGRFFHGNHASFSGATSSQMVSVCSWWWLCMGVGGEWALA
jgi:hypothetical protein